jgi:hypothetical protein
MSSPMSVLGSFASLLSCPRNVWLAGNFGHAQFLAVKRGMSTKPSPGQRRPTPPTRLRSSPRLRRPCAIWHRPEKPQLRYLARAGRYTDSEMPLLWILSVKSKALENADAPAAQAKAVGKAKGAAEKGTKRGTTRVSSQPASLIEAGIDKNLANRARKASLT